MADPAEPDDAAGQVEGIEGSEPELGARPRPADEGQGGTLITLAWVGTVLYVVTAVLATATTVQAPMIAISLVLFAVGLVAFAAAYLLAIARSREDAIGMGGLYFLAGTAPRRVQWHLLGATAVQTITATVTASVGIAAVQGDASNPLAFGFLVPLYGLGLAGLWGARYGVFAPRPPERPRAARPAHRPSPPDISG